MPLPTPFAFDFLPVRREEPSETAGGSAGSPSPTGGDAPEQEPGGLIRRFLRSLQSKETRRGYERDLESFFDPYRLVKGTGRITERDLRNVTREEILHFLGRERQHEGYSKNTIRHRATALRSFFRWLEKHGHVWELPFGREEGSSQLMKAALKAAGEGPRQKGSRQNRPRKEDPDEKSGFGGGAVPLKTLLPRRQRAGSELLEIRHWIRRATGSARFDPSNWEGGGSFSIERAPMMVTLPFRQLPGKICWALKVFRHLAKKARREGRVPQLKVLRIRGPQPFQEGSKDRVEKDLIEIRVWRSPAERFSKEGASRTSGKSSTSGRPSAGSRSNTSSGDGKLSAGVIHPALEEIKDEGPASRFAKWPVLEALAALYAREWSLPVPLYEQLQRTARAPLEQSRRGENNLPGQEWRPAGSEAARKHVAMEVTAALESAFRFGREETLAVHLRSRS